MSLRNLVIDVIIFLTTKKESYRTSVNNTSNDIYSIIPTGIIILGMCNSFLNEFLFILIIVIQICI